MKWLLILYIAGGQPLAIPAASKDECEIAARTVNAAAGSITIPYRLQAMCVPTT